MPILLRALPLSLAGTLLAGIACAQDELAKVQAGDELAESVAHHASSPVPQFDPTSFPGQLFWLTITFALLYLVMSRLVLPKIGSVVDNRAAQIARDLSQAQEDRTLAGALLNAHEARLADTRAAAQAASANAQVDAARQQAAELGAQGSRLAEAQMAAEARIEASRTAALAELAPIAAGATQAIIARLTDRTVDASRAQMAVTDALKARTAA